MDRLYCLAHLFHRIEGAGGEAMQFVGIDELQLPMFDGVQHGPLLPVGQHGGILTPGQDEARIGLDHLLQPYLGVGGLGPGRDIGGTAQRDGLGRPGRAADTGERRIPELIEHGDGFWLAVLLFQAIKSRHIGIGLGIGAWLQCEQLAKAAHLVRQRGKVGGFRVEDGDAELGHRGQHAGLGGAPGHHQIRLLRQQGFQVDAAVVGHLGSGLHLGRKIRGVVGGDDAIPGADVEQQLGEVRGKADDALGGLAPAALRPAEQERQSEQGFHGESINHGQAPGW